MLLGADTRLMPLSEADEELGSALPQYVGLLLRIGYWDRDCNCDIVNHYSIHSLCQGPFDWENLGNLDNENVSTPRLYFFSFSNYGTIFALALFAETNSYFVSGKTTFGETVPKKAKNIKAVH